jgi:hypothetical protein
MIRLREVSEDLCRCGRTYRQCLVFRVVELVRAECCIEVLSCHKVGIACCVDFSAE